jgi:hypothetical protein
MHYVVLLMITKTKICTKSAVDHHKLTEGIIFTMQFPMATVKKNALYVSKNILMLQSFSGICQKALPRYCYRYNAFAKLPTFSKYVVNPIGTKINSPCVLSVTKQNTEELYSRIC